MVAVPNAGLSGDVKSMDALRSAAARDPRAAVKEAAKQFEALFMQELMKSMRQATMSSGMLDNEATKLGTELLDTQFAAKMTGLPGGLSEAIARQLERQMGIEPGAGGRPRAAVPVASAAGAAEAAGMPRALPGRAAQSFVEEHGAAARAAEAASGIPAAFMIAQAAHETGWGRHEIRGADGSPSNNLFGIKAGPGWDGPTVKITTTEFVDGRPRKVQAEFRAYASAAESFADYARLIGSSPRYREALAHANAGSAQGFAAGLQRAGYATDPAYADKLARTINATLRLQRVLT